MCFAILFFIDLRERALNFLKKFQNRCTLVFVLAARLLSFLRICLVILVNYIY
jgi:hypothetical protein